MTSPVADALVRVGERPRADPAGSRLQRQNRRRRPPGRRGRRGLRRDRRAAARSGAARRMKMRGARRCDETTQRGPPRGCVRERRVPRPPWPHPPEVAARRAHLAPIRQPWRPAYISPSSPPSDARGENRSRRARSSLTMHFPLAARPRGVRRCRRSSRTPRRRPPRGGAPGTRLRLEWELLRKVVMFAAREAHLAVAVAELGVDLLVNLKRDRTRG